MVGSPVGAPTDTDAGWIGFQPQGIVELWAHAVDAAADLGGLRIDDPEADGPLRAVWAARDHLETGLLPAIRRILSSDVMTAFARSYRGGSSAAPAMADVARDVIDGDDDALATLHVLVGSYGQDLWTMRAFFTDLGGAGTAELLMALGGGDPADDRLLAIAVKLRSSLGDVTDDIGIPSVDFADELVGQFVERRDDGTVNAAAALSFVLRGQDDSTDLVVGLVRALAEHERTSSATGEAAWPGGMGNGSTLNLTAPTDDLPFVDDPRYAAMWALSRDGSAARAIFSDPDLAAELVGARSWDDGLRCLLAAGAAAALVPSDAPTDVQDEAAAAATQLVNRVGSADMLLDGDVHPDAARSAASVLAVHMLGVQTALAIGSGEVSAAELADLDLPTVGEDSFGPDFETTVALFGPAALGRFTDLAASSTGGVATLRAGLSNFQAARADGTARVVVDEELDDPNQFLQQAMVQSGALEGYFIQHIGHQAERIGRSQDAAIRFWIEVGTLTVATADGRAEAWTGVSVPFLSQVLAPAATLAGAAWADHEDGAARDAETNAAAATDRLTYRYAAALVANGAIESPNGAVPLPPYEEFERWPVAARVELWNALTERLPEGTGVTLSGREIELAVKAQQLEIYQQLE